MLDLSHSITEWEFRSNHPMFPRIVAYFRQPLAENATEEDWLHLGIKKLPRASRTEPLVIRVRLNYKQLERFCSTVQSKARLG